MLEFYDDLYEGECGEAVPGFRLGGSKAGVYVSIGL